MKNSINSGGYLRIPKLLFNDSYYSSLSCEAILLYGILWDRHCLSEMNKDRFTDREGRVFIYYTVENICSILSCGNNKAQRLLKELEKCDLIYRKRQGFGKPSMVYLNENCFKTEYIYYENEASGDFKTKPQVISKSHINNTYINNTELTKTEFNYTYPSIYDVDEVTELIKEQIEFDILSERNYGHILNDLLLLMVDTICGLSPTVRIGKELMDREAVRARFYMIDSSHIEYVIECFNDNKAKVRNIRSYLLTSLYNAPVTMEAYYDAMVKRDLGYLLS